MEVELKAEGAARRLNAAVAITVVTLATFMAVLKIKDDNIVQAMQVAKADALDTWNEYQAERLKQHLAEQALLIANIASASGPTAAVAASTTQSNNAIAKYQKAADDLALKAKSFEENYDALNFRDDQFDLSDAGIAIALSLAAVAALTGFWWLLVVAWIFAAGGVVIGVAGFAGWNIHPNWLINALT
jgi:hypothetical protein